MFDFLKSIFNFSRLNKVREKLIAITLQKLTDRIYRGERLRVEDPESSIKYVLIENGRLYAQVRLDAKTFQRLMLSEAEKIVEDSPEYQDIQLGRKKFEEEETTQEENRISFPRRALPDEIGGN